MVRPNKPGLEYFPLDCVMDDKGELIEAKYGITGFGVIIKLFQKIYSHGYYYKWGEEESLLFSKRINVDINILNDIINDSLRWHLFKKCLYERYKVLTSRGIQKRYIEATFRRKDVEIEKELLLVTITDKMRHVSIVQNEFMYTETTVNVDVTQTETPQSKVKKSKVKKSILIPPIVPLKNSYAEYVTMTNDEYEKLLTTYGKEMTDRLIEILDNYKGANGKKYKSDYRAILNWVVKGYQEEQAKPRGPDKPKNNKYNNVYL